MTEPTAGGLPLPTTRETAEASDGIERGDVAERDKALDEWMDDALQQDGYVKQPAPTDTLMTCLGCGVTVHTGAVALHDQRCPGKVHKPIPKIV